MLDQDAIPDEANAMRVITSDGRIWTCPAPKHPDFNYSSLAWRLINDSERLTKAECLAAAVLIRNYEAMLDAPEKQRNVLVRAYRKAVKALGAL